MFLLFLRLKGKVGAFLCGHKQLREFMNLELSFENYRESRRWSFEVINFKREQLRRQPTESNALREIKTVSYWSIDMSSV